MDTTTMWLTLVSLLISLCFGAVGAWSPDTVIYRGKPLKSRPMGALVFFCVPSAAGLMLIAIAWCGALLLSKVVVPLGQFLALPLFWLSGYKPF